MDHPPDVKTVFRTGWAEHYLDGSERAEANLVQQFMQRIHQVQHDNARKAPASKPGRAFHAKSHCGVRNAVLRIVDNLPRELQLGGLIAGQEYPATVRISNASGVAQADQKRDLRGIAVRVYGADSECDLLLTNAAASHARDARQFMDFARAASGSKLLLLPRLAFTVGLLELVRIFRTVLRQSSRRVSSLAREQFWSRAPYAIGPYAVKFSLVPLDASVATPGVSADYLREELSSRLQAGPVDYDLKVQLWCHEKKTPIEDGAVEWKEEDAPFIPLARLTIPAQDLTSRAAEDTRAAVDLMEFNPWRSRGWFRPLGSLNRARRLVYQSSALFRQQLAAETGATDQAAVVKTL